MKKLNKDLHEANIANIKSCRDRQALLNKQKTYNEILKNLGNQKVRRSNVEFILNEIVKYKELLYTVNKQIWESIDGNN